MAVCCSRASVRSAFLACSSREQPRVLDGDDRLVGEGLQESDLTVGEGPDLVPEDEDHSEQSSAPQHGDRQHGSSGDLSGP